MALYAWFHNTRDGKQVPGMGSDSRLPIDGRLALRNAHALARNQAYHLRYVQNYTHYRLFRGTIGDPRFITGLVELPPNHDYGKRTA